MGMAWEGQSSLRTGVEETSLATARDGVDMALIFTLCRDGTASDDKLIALLRSVDVATVRDTTDRQGLTIVHVVAQENRERVLDWLLNCGISPLVKTPRGDTPLHLSCERGSADIVQRLLQEGEVDVESSSVGNNEGNTPLHLACENGHLATVRELFDTALSTTTRCVTLANNAGKTPFGLAVARAHWDAARLVLQHISGCPATTFTDVPWDSLSPELRPSQCLDEIPLKLMVLGDQQSGKSSLITSLLTTSIIKRILQCYVFPWIGFEHVDRHKSGVVSTTGACGGSPVPRRCLTFFDVAGHREITPETLAKYTGHLLASESIFVITLDIRQEETQIEKQLLYWLEFVRRFWYEEDGMQAPAASAEKPKLLLVGTHANTDKLKKSTKLASVLATIPTDHRKYFNYLGGYPMDCCHLDIWTIDQLKCFFTSATAQDSRPECYVLSAFLRSFGCPVVSLSTLEARVRASNSKSIARLLPPDKTALLNLCQFLYNCGQVLLFEVQLGGFWIIIDAKLILTNINDTILPTLGQHATCGLVSSDRMLSCLEHSSDYPENFLLDFLCHFDFCKEVNLKHMWKLLRGQVRKSSPRLPRSEQTPTASHPPTHRRTLTDPGLVSIVTGTPTTSATPTTLATPPSFHIPRAYSTGDKMSASDETSASSLQYFFPAFLSTDPVEPWEAPDPRYSYSFSWVMETLSAKQVYLPDFIYRLILRCMERFVPVRFDSVDSAQRLQCVSWRRGIAWTSREGAAVCVAVHDNREVLLSMRSLAGREIQCLQLRNDVMQEVIRLKNDMYPEMPTVEYLVPGDNCLLPITDSSGDTVRYSKDAIAGAIREGQLQCQFRHGGDVIVLDVRREGCMHNPISLSSLLFFEPSAFLTEDLRVTITGEQNAESDSKISEGFCIDLAQRLGSHWKDLASLFGTAPHIVERIHSDHISAHDQAMAFLMQVIEKDTSVQTYLQLRQALSSISIFGVEV